MTTDKSSYLKPIATLQLIAVIAVVTGHFAVKDPAFMNSHWVSFCFVYSGFFTAMRHRFGSDYGLKDHAHFMVDKLAKLYPLHLLALALGFFDGWYVWGTNTINLKVLFTQLTLTSTWIPDHDYYFAFNPVGWFLCDLFFLYLMAPVLVKALRRCRLTWQILGIIVLLAIELVCGYTSEPGISSSFVVMYLLYEFPPIRLLDFATGIILYNITQSAWWQHMQRQVTANVATVIEIAGVLVFVLLYLMEKYLLFPHSKLFSIKPLIKLAAIGAEIYLLQFGVFYLLKPTFNAWGLHIYDPLQFALYFTALLVISWLTHHYYVTPVGKWLQSHHKHIMKP